MKKIKTVIVCGDFNVAHTEIDLTYPKKNENSAGFTLQERKCFDNLLNSGYYDCFRKLYPQKREYTWWSPFFKEARTKNVGWRLDYFLINSEAFKIVKDCRIRKDILGSDHSPVELSIEF